jgi:hypothetical protein
VTPAGKGTVPAAGTPEGVPHPSEGWAHETRTGPDKSQTAQEVFGVHVSRIPEVDKFISIIARASLESEIDLLSSECGWAG